jgi:hypothetical protein
VVHCSLSLVHPQTKQKPVEAKQNPCSTPEAELAHDFRRSQGCARATGGHAAMPPNPAMNSRRRIQPSR